MSTSDENKIVDVSTEKSTESSSVNTLYFLIFIIIVLIIAVVVIYKQKTDCLKIIKATAGATATTVGPVATAAKYLLASYQ